MVSRGRREGGRGLLGCRVGERVAKRSFYNGMSQETSCEGDVGEEGWYFEHMEEGGFASVVEAEEEELRMFVEEAK